MPMLVGAGVGALGSAITGKNPFKGALLGGATGGLTGGVSSLMNGGSFLEGVSGGFNPLSSQVAGTGVNLSSLTTPVGEGINLSSVPTTAAMGESGLGGIDLSQVANLSPDQLTLLKQTDPTLWEKLKPYITPSNMIGAANVASQFQPKQYQMSSGGGGGIKQANFQKPQGSLLESQLIPTVTRPRFY